MTASPEFPLSEAGSAQLQALTTLSALGWRYLTRAETDRLRGHRRSRVLLDQLLAEQLARINRIRRGERSFPFSEANIQEAVNRLTDVRYDGLLATNEHVTDLLQLGIGLPQTVESVTRSWQLHYVDWNDWRANDFAMTAEYSVSWEGGETIRADIVLFVNGIPWAIVETKNSRVDMQQGVSQQLRNQKPDDGAPNLFFAAQLLIAANPHKPRYATVGTPLKFWSAWSEKEDGADWKADLIRRPLDPIDAKAIFQDFAIHERRHRALMAGADRMGTQLDEMLVSLCRPERLLDLARRFTLFDGPLKKVARYQQFFSVRNFLKRIEERDEEGRRAGSVVWHVQGSGKSLTMVMMAKALAMAVPGARIVLVTDRTDLDDQIEKTFRATVLAPKRAKTGENLLELIEAKEPVITTLIHKFRAGLNKRKLVDPGRDVFVLVDESHRSQYGKSLDNLHNQMREAFPNACFVGFTGTPIAKRERNTFLKFGKLLDPVYPMRQAVEDGAVVPLLYEGRLVEEDVDEAAIDSWFERVTRDLSDKEKADLKRRMSRPREMLGVSARLKCIAFDVGEHFAANFKPLGFKGQLVAPSKKDAVALKALLDEFGTVTSEVVISAPDMRESETDALEDSTNEVKRFWKRMMELYRNDEEEYNRQIVDRFQGPGDPDLLIVVSKLLTGFDAPRNTALYLAKPMREHDLLQAITRVNRVFDVDGAPEKPFGYVIDYCGVLEDLSKALSTYEALQDFESEDVALAIASIAVEAESVPDKHAALLDLFSGVSNVYDEEAYAQELADDHLRHEFYERLSEFSRAFEVACASRDFVERTRPDLLERWRLDRVRLLALRRHVRIRYADAIDYKIYEDKVRALLDRHVSAHQVTTIIEPLHIFDDLAIDAALADGRRTEASVADEIAHRTRRTIEERWDEDPAFFERFSLLLRKVIDEFRARRLSEREYLKRVRELRDKVDAREDAEDPTPARVRESGHAKAFWGIARRALKETDAQGDLAIDIALAAEEVIGRHVVVGWQNDRDIENEIRNGLDDFYFDVLRKREGPQFDHTLWDAIVNDLLSSARVRMAR